MSVEGKYNSSKQPLVSVAIITYNQKEFLRDCIDSILAQDYENIEIIVADDCSTDGTQALLHGYLDICPEKLVLKLAESNQGVTKNSNVAHFACSGKYISWMGGDDLMLPGKIAAQVEVMEKYPDVSLCYHDLDIFDSVTGKSLGLFSELHKPREGTLADVVQYGTFNGACSTMVRASMVPQSGFDERLLIASDWKYWMDILKNGGVVNYIPSILGRYRRHLNNVTGSAKNVPIVNFQDHLATSVYLMSELPWLTKKLLKRQADLLRGVRNYDNGNNYVNYLRASLSVKFSFKSAIGLLLSYFSIRF